MFAINLIPWRQKNRESEMPEVFAGSPLTRLRSEMDQLFERFFGESFFGEPRTLPSDGWWATTGWTPSLDVTETENEVLVRAEVPGVDPKDFDIQLSGDVLTISGEKKEETEERRGDFYRAERRFGSFRRSIPLPTSVDPEKISAEYRNGVLSVRLEKTEVAKPKRIPVSVSEK